MKTRDRKSSPNEEIQECTIYPPLSKDFPFSTTGEKKWVNQKENSYFLSPWCVPGTDPSFNIGQLILL